MHIATNAIARCDSLHRTNSIHLACVLLAIDGCNLTLDEANLERLLALGYHLRRVGVLRQCLLRAQGLLATDAGAPQTLVDRVLQLGEVGYIATLLQVVNLVLASEHHIACWGDNLNLGCHNLECKVETNLVVTRTSRTVCYAICTHLLGILDDSHRLEDTLRRYRDRVGTITQYISKDHILDAACIVLLGDVECCVLLRSKTICTLLNRCQLLVGETARIGDCCVDLIAQLLGQVLYAERGVQTSTEC